MENNTPNQNPETFDRIKESAKQVLATAEEKVKNVDLSKGKNFLNKWKKFIIAGVAALVLVIAASIAIGLVTNNYMTPIKMMQKYENKSKFTMNKAALDFSNGLATKEIKKINKILGKSESDYYIDTMEEFEEYIIESYEDNLDEYGKNYKVKYKLIEKTELEKSDLRDYRDDLRYTVKQIKSIVDEADDFGADDWEDIADELEMSKGAAKDLFAALEDLSKELGRVEVTKGYELELERIVTGSELDEPEVDETTVVVLKVNGRWIAYDSFEMVFFFMGFVY